MQFLGSRDAEILVDPPPPGSQAILRDGPDARGADPRGAGMHDGGGSKDHLDPIAAI